MDKYVFEYRYLIVKNKMTTGIVNDAFISGLGIQIANLG